MNQNPGELRVWLCTSNDARFNSSWTFTGCAYREGGTEPDCPPVVTPYRLAIPLHQLVQVALIPPIDWGGLRVVMRRRLGVTDADKLVDRALVQTLNSNGILNEIRQ